jgi:hypothetical protein
MFEGVAFVAKYEKLSKKQAAHLLIEAGFKYYIIEEIKQDARARIKARELNQKVKITRFVLLFQKFCQEAGINMTTDWNIKEEK